jgi:hypothetical protein
MNKLEVLLVDKIKKFINDYAFISREMYTQNQRLIHPGEFGGERERISIELISQFITNDYSFSSGFIIDCKSNISTQCDIVIYDASNSKFLTDSNNQRFFPIESVVAIGEVKSIQSKSEFRKTINKLAKNKMLADNITSEGIVYNGPEKPDFDPINNPLDSLISFVICEKLDFDISNICVDIDGYYSKDVLSRYKHNLILSIEDGLLAYKCGDLYPMQFPPNHDLESNCLNFHIVDYYENYSHIRNFVSSMKIATRYKRLVDFNIGEYIEEKTYRGITKNTNL